MKDLSFLLLKNSLAAKMKKGFKNFCNGDGSTSTLNQHTAEQNKPFSTVTRSLVDNTSALKDNQPTLEEMLFQLEMEEKMARRAKLDDYKHRMSCVNSSDILRSARNALNQYPRFSLDGKDAMYRASFQNRAGRKSVCCNHELRRGIFLSEGCDPEWEETRRFPGTVAGESVVWCKPGVVAKLMGLEALPIPVHVHCSHGRERLSAVMRRQNLRRRAERHEMERGRVIVESNGCGGMKRGINVGSYLSGTSRTGHCVLNPIAREIANEQVGWPMKRVA